MKNSHKFFNNKDCKYFPCHTQINKEEFNCLFCYCPLYFIKKCGGNYSYIDIGTKKIKDCSACLVPHKKDSWEHIVAVLTHNAGISQYQDGEI